MSLDLISHPGTELRSPLEKAIDLADYLREAGQAHTSFFPPVKNSELNFSLELGCQVPRDSALMIGRIVGELVSNSVKYAHPSGLPGRISIACHKISSKLIVVQVADDGVGLPEGFDLKCDCGRGLEQVQSLADQLQAKFVLHSDPLGLTCTLEIPALND